MDTGTHRWLLMVWSLVLLLFLINLFNFTDFIKLDSSVSNITLLALVVLTVGSVLVGLTLDVMKKRRYLYTLMKMLGVDGYVSKLTGKLKFRCRNASCEVFFRTIVDTDFLCIKATLPKSLNLGLQLLVLQCRLKLESA